MSDRPEGMRQIMRRQTPMEEWDRLYIGTVIEFRTDLGDIRVGWDRNTGRIRVSVVGAGDAIDAIDIRPVGSNVVSIGLTGERMSG